MHLLTGSLLRAAAAAASLCLMPLSAQAAPTSASEIDVAGRTVTLSIWAPAEPQGVVIFSHGGGGSPGAYEALIEGWKSAGFMVVAPLHTDSRQHPGSDKSLQAAFATRIADVAAAQGWAAKAAPGLPHGYAGHSYGALMAMIRGGAMDAMVRARDPQARAVLAFSSPGTIPGLIGPDSFRSLAAPMLLVTGDKDLVPGFVNDPAQHLAAYDGSPAGDKYAWIGKGVDHGFAGKDAQDPAFAEAAALSTAFLKAYVLGDAEAQAVLKSARSSERAEVRTR